MTRIGSLVCATFLTLLLAAATAGSAAAAGAVTRATATTGDYTASVQVRRAAGRVRTTAVVKRRARGRVVRRFEVADIRARREPRGTRLLLSTRGDVAVAVRTPKGNHRLVVAPAGRRVRVAERDGQVRRLALEDDRTFSWDAGDWIATAELPVPAVPGRCPQRTGFAVAAQAGGMTVTQREYESPLDGRYGTMIRACDDASGTDEVVESVTFGLSGGKSVTTLGADGGSVVLLTWTDDRYDGCFDAKVVVRETREWGIRGGVPDRTWKLPDCSVALTDGQPRGALVVTPLHRQVAWVQPSAAGVRLVATSPAGTLRELDGMGASPITGLRTGGDGETVFWTRDGVERSAPL